MTYQIIDLPLGFIPSAGYQFVDANGSTPIDLENRITDLRVRRKRKLRVLVPISGDTPKKYKATRGVPEQLCERFMALPAKIAAASSSEEAERLVIDLANRYGTLVQQPALIDTSGVWLPHIDYLDKMGAWETVDTWKVKAEEMTDATEALEDGRLESEDRRVIRGYIGDCEVEPHLPFGAEPNQLVPLIRPKDGGLLSALWLQWLSINGRFKGYCAECGAPMFGKKIRKTCGDACRQSKNRKGRKQK